MVQHPSAIGTGDGATKTGLLFGGDVFDDNANISDIFMYSPNCLYKALYVTS